MTLNRLVAVVVEVADLDRSATLFRDGFGVPLKEPDDHAGDDRWISGRHCAPSWTDGAFLHFALYERKTAESTTGAQLGIAVADLDTAHQQPWRPAPKRSTRRKRNPGAAARYRDFDGNVIELTQRS